MKISVATVVALLATVLLVWQWKINLGLDHQLELLRSEKKRTTLPVISTQTSSLTSGSRNEDSVEIENLRERLAEAEKALSEAGLKARLKMMLSHPEIHLEALDEDLRVAKAIREILSITELEEVEINKALVSAKEAMASLEAESVELIEETEEQTVIMIPPIPDAEVVKQKLEESFRETLGGERATVLLDKSRNAFRSNFSDFGEKSLRVEFHWEKEDNIKLTQTISSPDGESRVSHTSFVSSLPLRYKGIVRIAD